MNTLQRKLIATSLLLVTATISFSQQNNEGQRPDGLPDTDKVFKDLDTNEDNKISLMEAKGPLKKDFNKIDSNEDGFITKEELEKAPKPKRKEKR